MKSVYALCLACWGLLGSLVPAMFNSTSCAQVHQFPQSHSGDNRKGTLFSWLHIYNMPCCFCEILALCVSWITFIHLCIFNIYLHIHIFIYTYIFIYKYLYIYIYICIYIYIYIFTYITIYMYTTIYSLIYYTGFVARAKYKLELWDSDSMYTTQSLMLIIPQVYKFYCCKSITDFTGLISHATESLTENLVMLTM